MSGITFGKMCLAQTPEEKNKAELNHREDVKNQPSDLENIKSFLSNCTTESDNTRL
jgi:hypothetical protein